VHAIERAAAADADAAYRVASNPARFQEFVDSLVDQIERAIESF
jgi:hypothetical protein